MSRRALLIVVALVLLVSGCDALGHPSGAGQSLSPSPVPSSGATGEEPPSLAAYYDQKVSWTGCQGGDQCAHIRVPLDYAKPAGQAISLALVKVPATDQADKVGALVVNPGGPGESGLSEAEQAPSYFSPVVLRSYDIVGFDPRGVGQSTPIRCLDTKQTDRFLASDPDPDTPAEVRENDALLRQLGTGCVRLSGDLAAHISTVEAAKDMDVIRALLGEPTLNYFGSSYGTFLGATYAGLFPKRVGRMVLDGALDPGLSTLQLSLFQARSFQVALRSYVANCVAKGSCFLGATVDAGIARIDTLLSTTDAKPLPTTSGRRLTEGLAVLGIWAPLYNRSTWSYLDLGLKGAFAGNGSVLLLLSDAYTHRSGNSYTDNAIQALYAINCLDHDDAIPSGRVARYFPEFEKASPTFGRILAFGLDACAQWPIHTGVVGAPIHAPGAPPLLVIGTTRDPVTPLSWARALARQLTSAVLIKRNGDGHTGYHVGNSCVDNTVNAYLVSGTVPKTKEVSC
ncbi:MAG: alpha/beta hydrolase [Nocardioidaceae bacterium]